MENHTRVLQQRVQVSAFVSSREQTNERVTGKEHEKRQADGNQTHNTDDAAITSCGRRREQTETAKPQRASSSVQKRMEPS